VCSGLSAQASADGQGWDQLIVTTSGQNLRALSPTNGIVMNSGLFSGYYDNYVSQVWQMYESATLSVDTQASYGTVTGQVSGGALTFSGVGSFGQPSAADIFGCNSGPFSPSGLSAEMLAILPRLAAAFNRSTLLTDSSQPDGENPADYYATRPPTTTRGSCTPPRRTTAATRSPTMMLHRPAGPTSPAPCPAAARAC
jgi:hypothetical protein